MAGPTCTWIAVVGPILPGQSLLGQENPVDSFMDTIDVRVINIETVVTDSSGNRFPGLGPEDFRLLMDGKEVRIKSRNGGSSSAKRRWRMISLTQCHPPSSPAMPPFWSHSSARSSVRSARPFVWRGVPKAEGLCCCSRAVGPTRFSQHGPPPQRTRSCAGGTTTPCSFLADWSSTRCSLTPPTA